MECLFGLLGLLFLSAGIAVIVIALVNKGIPLGSDRIIPTTPSVVLGLTLTTPLFCGFCGGTLYAMSAGFKKGLEAAKASQGRPVTQDQVMAMQQSVQQEILPHILVINVVVLVLAVVLPLIIAFTSIETRRLRTIEPPPEDYGFRAPPPPEGGYKPRDF